MNQSTYKAQTYHGKVKVVTDAGFEYYCDTTNDDGVSGEIFVAPIGNQYFGEVLDIFEDGSHNHYTQFRNQTIQFKF